MSLRTRDRILAAIIGLILLVTTVEMVGEEPIIAAGAAVMTLIALRMAFAGRCGWGTASCSQTNLDQHDVIAADAAGKD